MSTGNNYIVFDAGQIYGEYGRWPTSMIEVPDGAFVLCPDGAVYKQRWNSFIPLNRADWPPEIKMYRLIMGDR